MELVKNWQKWDETLKYKIIEIWNYDVITEVN